jgi:uncharacterized pyridoxamine 5'-phosphate oxidase family protein
MTRSEILDFVRKNTVSFMATVENGEPRVRGMDTPHVDENGLTFCTGANKQVSLQLQANPAVELCYWGQEDGIQLRLRGRMEMLDDEPLKKHIVETRFTFLKPVVEQYGWGCLALFRLGGGQASMWSARDTAGGSEEFPF